MAATNDRHDRRWDPTARRTDLDHIAPAPGVGVVTSAQARGVIGYGAIGMVVGLVIGALLALVPIDDWSYWGRLALFGGVCAWAGLIAGAVFGGGYEPETEGDVDIVDLREGNRQMRRRRPTESAEMPEQPSVDETPADAHPSQPRRTT